MWILWKCNSPLELSEYFLHIWSLYAVSTFRILCWGLDIYLLFCSWRINDFILKFLDESIAVLTLMINPQNIGWSLVGKLLCYSQPFLAWVKVIPKIFPPSSFKTFIHELVGKIGKSNKMLSRTIVVKLN